RRLEEFVQQVGDIADEQSLEQQRLVGAIHLTEHGLQRGWRLQEVPVQQPREPPPQLLEAGKAPRVVRAQAGDRIDGRFVGIPDKGGPTIRKWAEQVWVLGINVQPVATKLEVVDDRPLEHVADV